MSGGGKCYWSHGSSQARGVGILIGRNSEFVVDETLHDNAGRFIIIQGSIKSEKIILANVYAPNEDNPNFYSEFFTQVDKLDGKKIIMGDFNLVLDTKLDRNGGTQNNYKSQNTVQEYCQLHNLTDIWRDRYPNRRQYSWKRDKPVPVASRLDFVLIEKGISSWVNYIKMKKGVKSDHMLIQTELDINEQKQGPGFWRLNTTHLYNSEFVQAINSTIDNHIDLANAQGLDPPDKWEQIKLAIMYKARELSNRIAEAKGQNFRELEEALEKYDERDIEAMTDNDKAIYEKLKFDHGQILEEKAQSAIFRSKSTWYNEGEKNTRYFYNLERARSSAKNMNKIICNNEEISDSKVISHELHKFYSDLYTKDPSVKFNEQNNTNIKLTNEMKDKLEGEFSYEELTKALSKLKHKKAPGGDGLPVELYIVFWTKIGKILLEALNYGFHRGYLHKSALFGVITLIPKKDTRYLFEYNYKSYNYTTVVKGVKVGDG